MARKGGNKREKRLAAPKVRKILRKEKKFTVKSIPGPHPKNALIPLALVIRDMLKIANNLKEVKYLLTEGKIYVNNKKRRDYRFPVGLFDVISIPELKKNYRIVFDKKGRFTITEEKDSKTKICKIVGKKTIKGNKIVVITNDGLQIEDKENKIKVGDTIKINLEDKKIIQHLPLQKGSKAYIISGKHSGQKAKIEQIIAGTITTPKKVVLKSEDKVFETLADNVIAIE